MSRVGWQWLTQSPPDLAVYHDFDEFIPEEEIPDALHYADNEDDRERDDR